MDELTKMLAANRDALDPGWDEVRAARVRGKIDGAVAEGRRRGRTAALGATLVAAVGLAWIGSSWSASGNEIEGTPAVAVAPAVEPVNAPRVEEPPHESVPAVALADGSRAFALTSDTKVALVDRSPERVTLELARGVARFEVTPDEARSFEVLAGPVRVEVVGTRFEVARSARDVRVTVERGRVRVHLEQESIELEAGESHTFDTTAAADVVPAGAAPAGHAEAEVRRKSASPGWRELVARGDFSRSYEALEAIPVETLPDDANVLMDAADAARYSGHPRAAVPFLERVSEDHARDPRAPLAAFTLGRLLLDKLGQPRSAARAFARARSLAPDGDLAEDALAREVEAWARAGEPDRARDRAKDYVDRFPEGRRLGSVKKFGDIE